MMFDKENHTKKYICLILYWFQHLRKIAENQQTTYLKHRLLSGLYELSIIDIDIHMEFLNVTDIFFNLPKRDNFCYTQYQVLLSPIFGIKNF